MILKRYSGDLVAIDFLDLLVLDIYGGLRHVTVPRSYVTPRLFEEGIGFDASNFGFARVTNSDMVAVPDTSRAFVSSSDGSTVLHCLCDVRSTDGQPFAQYPRAVARRTVEELAIRGVADAAKMLVELEFYVFQDVAYATDFAHSYYKIESPEGIGEHFYDQPRFGIHKGYHRLMPEDRYFALRNKVVALMGEIDIPVKYHHHEVGASQLEIELDFMPLVAAADAVTLAKWIIKTVASEMGCFVTFMPKPIYKAAGNGMHVHQYLERGGQSLFPGDALFGLSPLALHYTAGILEHSLTGSLLALTNPSTNSYKRLVPGYEAPVNATFAKASRAAAVRIPGYLKGRDVRIEFRTGDAAANTYYMLSAMVLAGLDGIARQADPVALGFDRTDEARSFPLNLDLVLDGLEKDRDYLLPAFPPALLDLWIKVKREEASYVYNAPTPQEYELYF
ncbi:MAG: glutamine synthetase beta-grasp domain-containing protein [Vicinamibacteria bacterium]|nr:glutamine synthetase beta-grasp domain-containing protein [Vicinamibacteria bacterium]